MKQRDRREHQSLCGSDGVGKFLLQLGIKCRRRNRAGPTRMHTPLFDRRRDRGHDFRLEIETKIVARGEVDAPPTVDEYFASPLRVDRGKGLWNIAIALENLEPYSLLIAQSLGLRGQVLGN